jgi:hypothetical protein
MFESEDDCESFVEHDDACVVVSKVDGISKYDDMTKLVKLQSFKGKFKMGKVMWEKTVLEKYLGSFANVNLCCPTGTSLSMWITALSMKILELHMMEKKELWELVSEKSRKYLMKKVSHNNQSYQTLQDNAEEYVTKQKSEIKQS